MSSFCKISKRRVFVFWWMINIYLLSTHNFFEFVCSPYNKNDQLDPFPADSFTVLDSTALPGGSNLSYSSWIVWLTWIEFIGILLTWVNWDERFWVDVFVLFSVLLYCCQFFYWMKWMNAMHWVSSIHWANLSALFELSLLGVLVT